MGNPWDSLPDATSSPQKNPWDSLPNAAPARTDGLSDFKLPNGSMTVKRSDGAVYIKASNDPRFEGQEGWKYQDPETKLWAPAPAKNPADMGPIERSFGPDALRATGRTFAANAMVPIHNIANLVDQALPGEPTYAPVAKSAEDWATALKNTQGRGASVTGFLGKAAPDMALMAAAPEALPARMLPAAKTALSMGAATYLTTPGTTSERVNPAITAGLAGPLVEGGVSKTGDLVKAAKDKLVALGKTPSVQEALDKLAATFGGESAEIALKKSAQKKWDDAWAKVHAEYAQADASGAKVNYNNAFDTLMDIMAKDAKSTVGMSDAERNFFETKIQKIIDSQDPTKPVMNNFKGAMDMLKDVGDKEAAIGSVPGSLTRREPFDELRAAFLKDLEAANPGDAAAAARGRELYQKEVVPLFDKKWAGDKLKGIREAPDVMAKDKLIDLSQGTLTKVKPGEASAIAQGSSPEPLIHNYIQTAWEQAKGKPQVFSQSLSKAMPNIEAIARSSNNPELLEVAQGLRKVAGTANFVGTAGPAVLSTIPGLHLTGAAATAVALAKPQYGPPRAIWDMLQSKSARALLRQAALLPEGSPELAAIAAQLSAIKAGDAMENR